MVKKYEQSDDQTGWEQTISLSRLSKPLLIEGQTEVYLKCEKNYSILDLFGQHQYQHVTV